MPTDPAQPTQLTFPRTPYPRWWKDARAWPIHIIGPATQQLISPTPGYRTYISNIVLTVTGETTITLSMGSFGNSGPLTLGGSGKPYGMVIAMGNSPLPCGPAGCALTSTGSGVTVGGWFTYYYEEED